MDFGEFIAVFGCGYSRLIDHKSNKRLTKPYFCRYLLCCITKDENSVFYIDGIEDKTHERGESAFQAFYRNTDRRSLHPIAVDIVNDNKADTSKFKLFLKEYCKEYGKEKLLTNFKEYYPYTDSDALFDDITNEFVRILKEAAAMPDNRRKEPQSNSTRNCDNENSDSVEGEIEKSLQALIKTGRKIAEFRKVVFADEARYNKLKNSLHKDFEQLSSLSDLLSESNEIAYSPIVEDVIDSLMSLEENSFIQTTDEFTVESVKNYHIHRLIRLLSQLQDN